MTALQIDSAEATSRAQLTERKGVRADIQGLRAIAVTAVLVYHLWPHRLQGGYVGVDVFFVLSGFLITAHLLQRPTTTARSLAEFWGRRVRRLLPAATVVLLSTLIASLVWLPQSMLPRVAREAAAAALYSENWILASAATDYLSSHDAPSPLQHYWSLSVEEQFYVIWPLLIGAMFLLSRQAGRRGLVLVIGLGGLFLTSLTWSAFLTGADPSRAYFVTPTRMWELALGGLVALMFFLGVQPRQLWVRRFAAWLGLAFMGYAVIAFNAATAFPGLAALMPTVGTGLVLLADSDGVCRSPRALLSNPISQYLGGVSYSIYLWHWPLIVLAPFVIGQKIFWPHKMAIGVLAIVLGALTKKLIEDPVRRAPRLISSLKGSFAVGAACVLVVVAGGAAVAVTLQMRVGASEDRVAEGLRTGGDCFGAKATRITSCNPTGDALLTTPLFAREDIPDVYADKCWAKRPFTSHRVCQYGPKDATKKIALVGNSHAGHWQPALVEGAQGKGWQISTYLASECYPADALVSFPKPELTRNCRDWTARALREIKDSQFDLVVMSSRTFQPLVGVDKADQRQRAKEAYGRSLKSLTSNGTPVLVIRDVPGMTGSVPDCVDAHDQDRTSCSRSAKEAIPFDPQTDAARADPGGLVSVVDVNELLCPEKLCRSVIGGVIVFSDHGHLTKTFSRTLAPEITAAVQKRMG